MHRKIILRFAIVVGSAHLLTACASAGKTNEWKSLFDGTSAAGWRGYNQKDFPKHGWVVEDGCLHLLPGKGGGEIVTVEKFYDFEFEWEWRIAPRANNGIKYLVIEERPKTPGHEYQMIDNATAAGAADKHQTAAFYDVLAPQVKPPVKTPGEWNRSRLIIQGESVEHWLNGVKVLAYQLGSPGLKAAIADSKFKGVPGFGEKTRGHIMLTDHNGETWYRNLRIRELPAK